MSIILILRISSSYTSSLKTDPKERLNGIFIAYTLWTQSKQCVVQFNNMGKPIR